MIWWFLLIPYGLMVILYFRAISYQCVMAAFSMYDYSFKNFVRALFFPIDIIIWIALGIKENRSNESKECFDDFYKKRTEEYKEMVLLPNGKVKKIKEKKK